MKKILKLFKIHFLIIFLYSSNEVYANSKCPLCVYELRCTLLSFDDVPIINDTIFYYSDTIITNSLGQFTISIKYYTKDMFICYGRKYENIFNPPYVTFRYKNQSINVKNYWNIKRVRRKGYKKIDVFVPVLLKSNCNEEIIKSKKL